MTLKEYQTLAIQTIKPHDSRELAICDWALGLSGETAEVVELVLDSTTNQPPLWEDSQRIEFAKEIGDVLWYTVALMSELKIELGDRDFDEFLQLATVADQAKISGIYEALHLPTMTGGVCEQLKHHLMHKEALDTTAISLLIYGVWKDLHLLASFQGFTLAHAAELNVAKLTHRYKMSSTAPVSYDGSLSTKRHKRELQFTETEEYKTIAGKIVGGFTK